ncbi:sigma-70 family RNA polymerase sigma factor [Actinoplanes solisilvae]|uniref:sigma-70 family RNA polymerase sigma factor n=1 Tax=Actinoplanes solisilvae TaxID=2486853 RepID=UPI001F0C3C7E|nr:sigma-70 family RNA polymerase sigma factor [Actinoplanes solisilvae]
MTTQTAIASPTTGTDAEERMAALHAEHSRPLFHFLLGLTNGERHSAEDLLQETMLRAWRYLDAVPDESEGARRWLFTVARRVTIDAVRMRQARPAETTMLDVTWMPTTEDSPESVIAAESLRRAVHELSDAHRAILSELYVQGHTTEETANRLGVPIGTVKSRAHYAIRTLRDALFLVG